jgi:hypothetical protein
MPTLLGTGSSGYLGGNLLALVAKSKQSAPTIIHSDAITSIPFVPSHPRSHCSTLLSHPIRLSPLNMPRLVRRKPLLERLKATLNPGDFLLWLSEELETRDWDSNVAGTQLGLGLNFIFLLARANSGSRPPSDDIFRDDSSRGWLSLFVSTVLVLARLALSER